MDNKTNNFDSLVESLEEYGKTSAELAMLIAVKKVANLISLAVPPVILAVVGSLFMFSVTIGVALWIGELFGKSWIGFVCMAGFYGLAAILIVFCIGEPIRRRVSRLVISRLLIK
jgi:hypothetical protein